MNIIQVGGKLLLVMQQSQLGVLCRWQYCLAGWIPKSSEEQNSFGPGGKRVGVILISPKLDAL